MIRFFPRFRAARPFFSVIILSFLAACADVEFSRPKRNTATTPESPRPAAVPPLAVPDLGEHCRFGEGEALESSAPPPETFRRERWELACTPLSQVDREGAEEVRVSRLEILQRARDGVESRLHNELLESDQHRLKSFVELSGEAIAFYQALALQRPTPAGLLLDTAEVFKARAAIVRLDQLHQRMARDFGCQSTFERVSCPPAADFDAHRVLRRLVVDALEQLTVLEFTPPALDEHLGIAREHLRSYRRSLVDIIPQATLR